MDRESLVMERDIPAGRKLVDLVQDLDLPLTGAGWMYETDTGRWSFCLVTPAAGREGPLVVRRRIREAMEASLGPDFPIDTSDIIISDVLDSLPVRVMAAAKGREPVERVRYIGFVENFVPDAYVYRLNGEKAA